MAEHCNGFDSWFHVNEKKCLIRAQFSVSESLFSPPFFCDYCISNGFF